MGLVFSVVLEYFCEILWNLIKPELAQSVGELV